MDWNYFALSEKRFIEKALRKYYEYHIKYTSTNKTIDSSWLYLRI